MLVLYTLLNKITTLNCGQRAVVIFKAGRKCFITHELVRLWTSSSSHEFYRILKVAKYKTRPNKETS